MGRETAEPVYEDLLCYWDWCDVPIAGIAVIGGRPQNFECIFSDELDAYTDEYWIWPTPEPEVDEELREWASFSEWRSRFDQGRAQLDEYFAPEQLAGRTRNELRPRPGNARLAKPEWRLDRPRSFADWVPHHQALWSAE
jgi:hypothetical protein